MKKNQFEINAGSSFLVVTIAKNMLGFVANAEEIDYQPLAVGRDAAPNMTFGVQKATIGNFHQNAVKAHLEAIISSPLEVFYVLPVSLAGRLGFDAFQIIREKDVQDLVIILNSDGIKFMKDRFVAVGTLPDKNPYVTMKTFLSLFFLETA